MTFRALILWTHVLCGVVCVGVCTTFVLTTAVLASEPDESYVFVLRTVPQINRLCAPMALAIPITGIANLIFVAQARGSVLPPEFIGILSAKIGLLAVMAIGLAGARRAETTLENQSRQASPESTFGVTVRRIRTLYGLIIGAGAAALGLGVWLSGT